MRRAESISEINAVTGNFVVGPDHPFYVDFMNLRGDFQERTVRNAFNLDSNGRYISDSVVKSLVFLAGMRGSGKTSELKAIAKKLETPEAFLVVTCNLDDSSEGLNMVDIEYVDILFYQLEQLAKRLAEKDLPMQNSIVQRFKNIWTERIESIEKADESSLEVEAGMEVGTGPWNPFVKIFGKLKAGVKGSEKRTEIVRREVKNNFVRLAAEVNTFFLEVAHSLRENNVAQEILFVIDGLEKVMSADGRRKVLMDEFNFLTAIKGNTLYTLPIELHKERAVLERYPSEVISFPFIKILQRDGSRVTLAYEKLTQFVHARIKPELFSGTEVIDEAICVSGGSPRQLLRILRAAGWEASDSDIITLENMKEAIRKESNQETRYLTDDQYKLLYELEQHNRSNPNYRPNYKPEYQELLEKEAIMEYNDGFHKRVNPLILRSENYQLYHPNPTNE